DPLNVQDPTGSPSTASPIPHFDRHRPEPPRRQRVEHPREDLQDLAVAAALAKGGAVVEEEDVSRGEPVEQAPRDSFRIPAHGVEAAPGPRDEAQAGAMENSVEERIAQAGWGTEEARPSPGCVRDGLLGALDLAPQGTPGI